MQVKVQQGDVKYFSGMYYAYNPIRRWNDLIGFLIWMAATIKTAYKCTYHSNLQTKHQPTQHYYPYTLLVGRPGMLVGWYCSYFVIFICVSVGMYVHVSILLHTCRIMHAVAKVSRRSVLIPRFWLPQLGIDQVGGTCSS